MQNRKSLIPNLPSDLGDDILKRVENSEISSCLLVNKTWTSFFSNKVKSLVPEVIEKLTPSICLEKTLAEIKPNIDWILSIANPEQKKSLYLTLKLLEAEIIDITANPLYRSKEYDQRKINIEEFNQYLIEKFGIAGLINTWTFKRIFEYNGNEDIAKAFAELVALQYVLQTKNDLIPLEWICTHLTNSKYGMNLEFKENELHLVGDQDSMSINNIQEEMAQSGQFSKYDYEAGVATYNKILTSVGCEIPQEKTLTFKP